LAASVASPAAAPSVFRREGEYWSVAFDGQAFRLKDIKGLQYLAHLLRHPGHEFHALDLVSAGQNADSADLRLRQASDPSLRRARPSDLGPVLDQQAKAAYRQRLRDLDEELTEATQWADSARAAKLRQEMQLLVDQLAGAAGLNGRDRKAGSAAERARVNVTRAISTGVTRIRRYSPPLADHLAATVRTGTFCSYSPDPRAPITWRT